jgi:hypothetical protein
VEAAIRATAAAPANAPVNPQPIAHFRRGDNCAPGRVGDSPESAGGWCRAGSAGRRRRRIGRRESAVAYDNGDPVEGFRQRGPEIPIDLRAYDGAGGTSAHRAQGFVPANRVDFNDSPAICAGYHRQPKSEARPEQRVRSAAAKTRGRQSNGRQTRWDGCARPQCSKAHSR